MCAYCSRIFPLFPLIWFLLCLSFSSFLKWEAVSVSVVIPSGRLRSAPRQQLVVITSCGEWGGTRRFWFGTFSSHLLQPMIGATLCRLIDSLPVVGTLTSSAGWSLLSPAMFKIKFPFHQREIKKWKSIMITAVCVCVCMCACVRGLFSSWSLSCWHTFPQQSKKNQTMRPLLRLRSAWGRQRGTGSWIWTAAVKPVGPVCD